MTLQNTATQVATADNAQGMTTYTVAGQEIKLSFAIVRNYLTKGNGNVSDQDLVQFISICKFNQLNPFLNEAYLVKFGTQPAQMIVSKEALMKRADACPNYEGMVAGVIIEHEDGKFEDVEGTFFSPKDKLVGGWAKVYRNDRRYPFVSRVSLSEYDKKQSSWNEKKSTMIAKVAKVQALREAFPAQLGAMYTTEERGVQDVAYEEVKAEVQMNANKETITMDLGNGEAVDTATGEVMQAEAPKEATIEGPGF